MACASSDKIMCSSAKSGEGGTRIDKDVVTQTQPPSLRSLKVFCSLGCFVQVENDSSPIEDEGG